MIARNKGFTVANNLVVLLMRGRWLALFNIGGKQAFFRKNWV